MSADKEMESIESKLNTIIAILLALAGDAAQEGLLKKRKANPEIVHYFSKQLGLANKDLAAILNTTESGISNLKKKKKPAQ